MTPLPAGSCDTHMHVYDSRYPTAATATLFPPDATVADYRAFRATLGLQRVVIVQPTTYGLDNACQADAAADLGPDARLVVVVDDRVTDAELRDLDERGARGARFHMLPGGAVGWDLLDDVARRIAPIGWHVQLQMDGNRLPERLDQLLALPTPLVVDHVGRFMPPPSPDSEAFRALLALLGTGNCWVKLSAPYESTRDGAPRYPAVTALVEALVDHRPDRMLWATNWPHPGQIDPPTVDDLSSLLVEWLPEEGLRQQVLVDNPAMLYGFGPVSNPNRPEPTRTDLPEGHR